MMFVAELCHGQIEGNRYFLHEHPRYATSWHLDCMKRLQELPGVETVRGTIVSMEPLPRMAPTVDVLWRNPQDSYRTQLRFDTLCLAYAKDATVGAREQEEVGTPYAKAASPKTRRSILRNLVVPYCAA